MKIVESKRVPDGVCFVNWKDNLGNIWKDIIPLGYLEDFKNKEGVNIILVKTPINTHMEK